MQKRRRDLSRGSAHAGLFKVFVNLNMTARASCRSHIAVIGGVRISARSYGFRARRMFHPGESRSTEHSWHCCQDDYGGSKPTAGYRFTGPAPVKPSNCHAPETGEMLFRFTDLPKHVVKICN